MPEDIRLGIEHPGSDSRFLIASSLELGWSGQEILQVAGWQILGWQLGLICLVGNCLCTAISMNIQAPLLKIYPAPVSLMAYAYAVGAISLAVTACFLVPDDTQWALGVDANLLVVDCNGVVSPALNLAVAAWCLERVGLVFVRSFIPLLSLVVAGLGFIVFGTNLHLESSSGKGLEMVITLIGWLLVSRAMKEWFRFSVSDSQNPNHLQTVHDISGGQITENSSETAKEF